MNLHTAQNPPQSSEQTAAVPSPSATPPAGRVRLGPWLWRWVERVAAASERAQAHITAQFKVPPGGG